MSPHRWCYRAYLHVRAALYRRRHPDPYIGFNPWRVKLGEDDADHGDTIPFDEWYPRARARTTTGQRGPYTPLVVLEHAAAILAAVLLVELLWKLGERFFR